MLWSTMQVTMFHEFGHVMHELCSRTDLKYFAGEVDLVLCLHCHVISPPVHKLTVLALRHSQNECTATDTATTNMHHAAYSCQNLCISDTINPVQCL